MSVRTVFKLKNVNDLEVDFVLYDSTGPISSNAFWPSVFLTEKLKKVNHIWKYKDDVWTLEIAFASCSKQVVSIEKVELKIHCHNMEIERSFGLAPIVLSPNDTFILTYKLRPEHNFDGISISSTDKLV